MMSDALIETARLDLNLTPRPIEPSWIIEGNPVAQCYVLSRSADGLASTMVWECSEGRFNWYYDFDETVLILEGSIVLAEVVIDIPCSDAGTLEAGRQAERLIQKRKLGRRHLGEQPLDELLECRDRRVTVLQMHGGRR